MTPAELILDGLRRLAAEARKPNPFDGWTIAPWKNDDLLAHKGAGASLVGAVYNDGWVVWGPAGGEVVAEGRETGNEGRKLAEDALMKAGATIPWRKGKDR
jgi:hypothetical protein